MYIEEGGVKTNASKTTTTLQRTYSFDKDVLDFIQYFIFQPKLNFPIKMHFEVHLY